MAEKRVQKKATAKKGTKKQVSAQGAKKVLSAKKRVAFSYHAPQAAQVCLAGSFNQWDAGARPLTALKNGNWTTTMYLLPGRYEYRFVVDGIWVDDPQCTIRCANEHGSENCVVILEA